MSGCQRSGFLPCTEGGEGILLLLRSTCSFTNAGHPRRSRATTLTLDGLLPKYGSRRNTISLPASLRFLPTIGSNSLNFANSAVISGLRHANCLSGRLFSPTVIRGTLRRQQGRPQACSKTRLAKSSSCSLHLHLSWATVRQLSNTAGQQDRRRPGAYYGLSCIITGDLTRCRVAPSSTRCCRHFDTH